MAIHLSQVRDQVPPNEDRRGRERHDTSLSGVRKGNLTKHSEVHLAYLYAWKGFLQGKIPNAWIGLYKYGDLYHRIAREAFSLLSTRPRGAVSILLERFEG